MTTISVIVVAAALFVGLAEAGDAKDKAKALIRVALVEQKPILLSGERRTKNRQVGMACRFSSECSTGCCVQAKLGRRRRCQSKAKKGDLCSIDQIKGGAYLNHCPCEKGDDFCPTGKDQKCQG